MLKDFHESALPVDEIQDAADINLLETIENGMIGFIFIIRVYQAPTGFTRFDLDRFVLTVGDPLIDRGHPFFQFTFKGGQMFFDGQFKDRASGAFDELLFVVTPCFVVDQIVLEAAESDAIVAIDVAPSSRSRSRRQTKNS